MVKLKEIIQTFNELESYKEKYGWLLDEYNHQIENLYAFEFEKWENTKPEIIQQHYKEQHCISCKYNSEKCVIPSNVYKPEVKENYEGRKVITYQGCSKFEWK